MTLRKKIFIVLLLIIQLGIIWPGLALFSDIYPLILGLPLSFAWIAFMLICAFLLLLWYYLSDPEHKKNQSQSETNH